MPGHFLRPDNCKDTFFAEHDALFKEFFFTFTNHFTQRYG